MSDLKQTRNRLYLVIAVLVLLDVAAVALLMTPLAGRESSRQEELRQSWQSLKARQSAPWRGLDKKIPQARTDIDAFYRDRLPGGYSAISTEIDNIASASGVRVSTAKYTQKDSDVASLQQVEIEAEVSGDYVPLAKFINTLERSQLFFIIDGLELGGVQTGQVRLRIKLETFLRTA